MTIRQLSATAILPITLHIGEEGSLYTLKQYHKVKESWTGWRLVGAVNFAGNIARIGAAVDWFCKTFDSTTFQECSLTPEIINCNFVNNGGMYTYQDGTRDITDAIVDLVHLPAIFRSNIPLHNCYMTYSYSCFVCYIKPGVHPDDWIAALHRRRKGGHWGHVPPPPHVS